MLSTKSILSFIMRFVSPSLDTLTMLEIIFPFALVLCSIYMSVGSKSICLVICPISIIYVTIYMNKLASSMCTVFSPFTNILCTIRPGLLTMTITETTFPLTSIDCSCFELVGWSSLSCLIWIIYTFCNGFFCFVHCKIFATSHLFGSKQ